MEVVQLFLEIFKFRGVIMPLNHAAVGEEFGLCLREETMVW